jgi:hypothetical protein
MTAPRTSGTLFSATRCGQHQGCLRGGASSNDLRRMPILDADKAANVVVLKRSMASSFVGIDNPLFDNRKAVARFGATKKSIDGSVAGVKAP